MALDGTDFRPLDADCVGNDTDQAVDVFVEQQTLSNRQFLTSGRSPVHCTFYQNPSVASNAEDQYFPGDRPISSIAFSAPVYVPFYVGVGLRKINVYPFFITWAMNPSRASGDPAAAPFVDVMLSLFDPRDRLIKRTSIAAQGLQDGVAGNKYPIYMGSQDLAAWVLDLGTPYRDTPGYGRLEISVRSRLEEIGPEIRISTGQPAYSNNSAWITQGSHRIPISNPRPGDEAPEVQALVGVNSNETYDILGVIPDTSTESVFIWPPANIRSRELDVWHLSYIVFRDIAIEPVYDVQSISPQSRAAILPWEPVRSDVPMGTAQAPPAIYQRKKLIAWGPPGYIPEGRAENWPGLYHTRWTSAGGAGVFNLIDESILIDAESGTLDIVFFVCVTRWNQAFQQVENETAVWDFTADLLSFDVSDSDWSTPDSHGTISEEIVVPMWKTLPANAPILAGAYLRKIGYDVGFGSLPDFTSWFFPTKEGQVFDADKPYIFPVKISVDFSEIDVDTLYRLRLTGERTGGEFPPTIGDPADLIVLQLIGYTVWQEGSL